jgi:hypothetical protein
MSAEEMTVFAVNEFGIDIVPEPLRGMASPRNEKAPEGATGWGERLRLASARV